MSERASKEASDDAVNNRHVGRRYAMIKPIVNHQGIRRKANATCRSESKLGHRHTLLWCEICFVTVLKV